ncbi:PRC-barrel domain-containing protein [Paracoccus bogoriensis]|uniref:PRC-barrel domain-containing protein n=1 Tax=Paracoccus bogoriensis TaxID=242065 RepID=UPI001CA4CFC5|nr:PRC-barrel domain-containing protein [Paracoccus bogoriensis]MBW7056646.1 PRC-barrel domain-containing protein [Paracoccus bogoriensis]
MRNHLKGSVAMLALLGGPAIAQQAQEAQGVVVETCAPVVTVTQTPPEIRITIPEDPAADPQVVVLQAPPAVEVVQCPPVITGAEAQITEAEPEIVVNAAETAELVVTRMDAAGQAAEDQTDQQTEEAAMSSDQPADEADNGLVVDEAAGSDTATGATGDQAAQPPAGLVGEGEGAAEDAPDAAADQPAEAAPEGPEGADVQVPGDAGGQGAQTDAEAAGSSPAGPTGAVQPSTGTGATSPATTLNTQAEATEGPVTEGLAVEQSQADGLAPDATAPLAQPAPDASAEPVTGRPQGQPLLREGNVALTLDEAMAADLGGADVIASDDEAVGRIDSVDAASGTILVGVGGFLGLGERDLTLPMDEVSFQRDADGVLRAYLAMPSETVEAMAEEQAGEAAQ